MECRACGYENPREASACLECGTGLRWAARQRAERHFRHDLETARHRAADERLERTGGRRRPGGPTP